MAVEDANHVKIIFLDVDGVLNSVHSQKNEDGDIHIIDLTMIERLVTVIEKTDAKVANNIISISFNVYKYVLHHIICFFFECVQMYS